MDIKKENCVQALKEIGMREPERFLGEFAQKGPFAKLEEGLMTPGEFHEFVRTQVDGPVTDRQIDTAFCRFLIGIPVERLRQLQLLRQKYGIYMLSNTNPIMWNSTIEEEFRKDGLTREEYFDGIVTSFNAKVLKPDPGIFEYAVEKLGIKPGETCFLDDSETNTEAARALGFHTAHVPDGKEFYDILADMNLV